LKGIEKTDKEERKMKPFRTETVKNTRNGKSFLAECYGVGMNKIKVVLTDEFG